jgi:putative restriction endonuclease
LPKQTENKAQVSATAIEVARFVKPHMMTPRLGQGSFRVAVTESYERRCAMTGEKTLLVLEAAHIKPFSEQGPHLPSNGLLLRADLHTLFDRGLMTVTTENRIEVSAQIKEAYGNGKVYYALHGQKLQVLPQALSDRNSLVLLCSGAKTVATSEAEKKDQSSHPPTPKSNPLTMRC